MLNARVAVSHVSQVLRDVEGGLLTEELKLTSNTRKQTNERSCKVGGPQTNDAANE